MAYTSGMISQPLNADFEFSQLSDKLRQEVLAAFHGTPRKVTFAPGVMFYRWVTPRKGDSPELSGNGVLDGRWWFSMEVWNRITRAAFRKNTPIRNAARSKLAVTTAFNREMEYMCRIVLQAPVCGWVGPASAQHDPTRGRLPGGSEQIYFPSLAVAAGGIFSSVARLDWWGYPDDGR